MTKIVCPKCNGMGFTIDTSDHPNDIEDWYYDTQCDVCKGKKWIPHPTCQQCGEFYLEDMGFPSKVAKCRVHGIVVNPMGYCFVNSELLEEN